MCDMFVQRRAESSHHVDCHTNPLPGNNNQACAYDDGDCCGVTHGNQFQFCEECHCVDPNHKGECAAKCGQQKYKGDNHCDDGEMGCTVFGWLILCIHMY